MSKQTENSSRYIDTRGMSRQQWLEARQTGLGGSDIAAILGLHPYKSSYDVWLDKTGREKSDIDNYILRFGRDIEPQLASWFTEDTGFEVQRDNMMWIHPRESYLIANLDFKILQNDEYEGNGVLECKSTNYWTWKQVEDEVPKHWYLQMQHYCMIKGYEYGAIAALVDRKPEYLFFDADPEIHELILNEAGQWWEQHIIKDEAPEPVVGDDLARVYSKIDKKKAIEAEAEQIAALKRLEGLKAQKKEIEEQIKQEEFTVEKFIGEQEARLLNEQGDKICTRSIVSFDRLDNDKLKEKYPDVVADPEVKKNITYSRLYY